MSTWLRLDGCVLEATNYANEFVLLRPKASQQIDLPALGRAMLDQQFAFVEEVIATEVEICLKLNEHFQSDSLLAIQQIKAPSSTATSVDQSSPLQAPIWFSSRESDWEPVCQQTQLTRDRYIELLLDCRFRVAMIGFLPGFLYLRGLPTELQAPRKETPDQRTAANTFAIGGRYAGIYSLPSPAGWHIIGSLGVQLLRTDQLPPLLLQPGDEVTLQQVDEAEYQHLVQQRLSLWEYNGNSYRR